MTPDELARDHRDLLWLMEDLRPGSIHRDTRCIKMPAPHVLTPDCDPKPKDRDANPLA